MVALTLRRMITLLLSILLSHNVSTTQFGFKTFLVFQVTTDVPITQQYAADYAVTFSTGTTNYYHIVFEPNPNTTFFQMIPVSAGTQVTSYTMSGWGPVNAITDRE